MDVKDIVGGWHNFNGRKFSPTDHNLDTHPLLEYIPSSLAFVLQGTVFFLDRTEALSLESDRHIPRQKSLYLLLGLGFEQKGCVVKSGFSKTIATCLFSLATADHVLADAKPLGKAKILL